MYKKNVLTNEQRTDIINKYITGEYTCAQLARNYGVWPNTINGLLRRRKIPIYNDSSELKRKYTLNQNYFDIIDTEEKAYFLGFLFADGCNHESKNTILISLQELDKHILETFKICIDSSKPLYVKRCDIDNKRKIKTKQKAYELVINSKHMSAQLARLGCVQAKSLILEFPSEDIVPSNLIRHFIRGYFDGDGCCYISKPKNYKVTNYGIEIMSTKMFCDSISTIIKNELSISTRVYDIDILKYKSITKKLRFSGINKVFTFLDWIYKDSNIYLNRKYDKYLYIKEILNKT